ncbi:single-strand DNA endonuclease ASTE1-like isoform X1 [Mytilus edulis]|uniref:single-strand DNA endonuclease ASTE1-like isoform X1 n=2 Tax=Mytilus edulis TaxID=6550 RepID=UPI0039F01AF7
MIISKPSTTTEWTQIEIMGIRGLRSFIEKNGSLQPYILKDTRVVIDGNNICHHLLYIGTCRHYGGNYIEIRQNAQSFFQALLKCNIKPYVVFDGGYDDDDKKLQNIITKCELRIKENEEKPPKHMECFPVLAYESFTMVLKELNIPHLTCDGEADNQIAVLARQWNCPVISCDSDMYIFDLPGGFINFSDINLDQPTSGELNTRLYVASKFEDSIGLHTTLLPVAATVIGSLYADIDNGIANLFFKRLGGKSSFANISRNLKYAFELLKNARSQQIAIAILMQCVDEKLPSSKTEELKEKIYSSVSAYNAGTEFTGFDIAKYFEGTEYTKHYKCLPDCVIEKIRSCTLSGMPINVALGRVILKPTFEHFDLLPIQHISRPLRQIIYGLVLKSCTNGVEYVTEIVRDKRLMTKEPIKPVVEVSGYGLLPTLQEIDGQDKRNKIKLLAAIFTFDEKILESLPSESRVFALALKYFISNTCPYVTVHLKIYALCHVILLYREFPNVQSFYNMLSSSTANEKQNVELFHENLQRFQECLNMAYTINVLLGTPLKQPDPATVFDGILMYNFFLKEPTEYVVDQLAKTHFLKEQMLKLYNALLFI